MAGNPQEIRAKLFVSGEGECVSIQGPMPSLISLSASWVSSCASR